jgi:nicotinamide mononucleotide transporter
MSYLEFFGTIFTAWSVWLAAKNKISTWPVSIIGIVLYGLLFYQIQLYSDLFEQVYYFVTALWGWYLWNRIDNRQDVHSTVTKSTYKQNLFSFVMLAVLTVSLAKFMANIHVLFPVLFSVPASFPLVDSFTTVLSLIATVYLAKRKIENWYLWIVVDVIGVWLYYEKGVIFLSVLYLCFLINAFYGLYKWRNQLLYGK